MEHYVHQGQFYEVKLKESWSGNLNLHIKITDYQFLCQMQEPYL